MPLTFQQALFLVLPSMLLQDKSHTDALSTREIICINWDHGHCYCRRFLTIMGTT